MIRNHVKKKTGLENSASENPAFPSLDYKFND